MRLLLGHDDAVRALVARLAPLERPEFGPSMTIAIVDASDRLVGGIVYHNYRPKWQTIELSGASVTPRAASPQTARGILAFAFEKLGVQKIWTQSGLSNRRALKLLKWAGFTQEAILAHEYGDEHCVRMRLLRREWERMNGLRMAKAA